jgi:hypothetical protein
VAGALALGLALAVSGPVLALDPPAKPSAPPAATRPTTGPTSVPITSPDYVIGVNDVVCVRAVGNDEVDCEAPVLADGVIVVKGIPGTVRASRICLPDQAA